MLKKVRQPRPPETGFQKLLREVRRTRPKADLKAIERAYGIAEEAHRGQLRKSGHAFITHPLGVATILAQLGLDETTVAAALLHDSVEDTYVSLADVEKDLGYEVAALIDGVTKLDKIGFRSIEQTRAENLRKMMIATAKDIRVILIKIADRLHNMRTLDPLRPEKRELIASTTSSSSRSRSGCRCSTRAWISSNLKGWRVLKARSSSSHLIAYMPRRCASGA